VGDRGRRGGTKQKNTHGRKKKSHNANKINANEKEEWQKERGQEERRQSLYREKCKERNSERKEKNRPKKGKKEVEAPKKVKQGWAEKRTVKGERRKAKVEMHTCPDGSNRETDAEVYGDPKESPLWWLLKKNRAAEAINTSVKSRGRNKGDR